MPAGRCARRDSSLTTAWNRAALIRRVLVSGKTTPTRLSVKKSTTTGMGRRNDRCSDGPLLSRPRVAYTQGIDTQFPFRIAFFWTGKEVLSFRGLFCHFSRDLVCSSHDGTATWSPNACRKLSSFFATLNATRT